MELYTFLPSITISLLHAIPTYLLAKSKGYTGIFWLIVSIFPLLNLFALLYIVGLPDKIMRNHLLDIKIDFESN